MSTTSRRNAVDAVEELSEQVRQMERHLEEVLQKAKAGPCPLHGEMTSTVISVNQQMATIAKRIEEGNVLFREISNTCAARGVEVEILQRDLTTHLTAHGAHRCETQSWKRLLLELIVLVLIAGGSAWFGGKQAAAAKSKPVVVPTQQP